MQKVRERVSGPAKEHIDRAVRKWSVLRRLSGVVDQPTNPHSITVPITSPPYILISVLSTHLLSLVFLPFSTLPAASSSHAFGSHNSNSNLKTHRIRGLQIWVHQVCGLWNKGHQAIDHLCLWDPLVSRFTYKKLPSVWWAIGCEMSSYLVIVLELDLESGWVWWVINL